MKKIVFLNSTMQAGGPARVINLWSNHFIDKGYDVEIVSNIDVPLFYDFNKKVKYSILGIDKFQQRSRTRTFFKIFKFIDKRRNEIHIYNKALYIPYLYLLKKIGLIDKSIKLVYFAHGGSSDFITLYDNFKNYMIACTFDNVIALHNDYDSFDCSTVNKTFKRKIIDKIFKDYWQEIASKIVYIPNPVTFYVENPSNLMQKNVLAVGRLDKVKGFDLLIKSWKLICDDIGEWRLRIIGSGQEEYNLKRICEELDVRNIEFIPQQLDVKQYYVDSSIYVMSSIEEGMPMVVIEAMECGLPIVAFDNVGAKFLVKHGKNGLVCRTGDIATLSKNLKKLMDDFDLRLEFGKTSKEYAKKFHIENISPKWESILGKNNV